MEKSLSEAVSEQTHSQSVKFFHEKFSELQSFPEDEAKGYYRAEFVGPWWLRKIAPLSLPLVKLGGWCGKRIIGNGHAVNLVRGRHDNIREVVPMNVNLSLSRLDKKPSLTLTYPSTSPLMLRFFVDELRRIDDDRILGMTVVDLPLIRRFPLPFLLHKPQSR